MIILEILQWILIGILMFITWDQENQLSSPNSQYHEEKNPEKIEKGIRK